MFHYDVTFNDGFLTVPGSMTTNFKLWREQRVILAVASGSWDRLTAEDYAEEFKRLAAPLADAPWAHIVYLDQWQLGVPAIEPVIRDLVQWCTDNNLRHVAQVYCPHMVKKYQLDRMIIDRSQVFEKRVYPTEQEAFAWLSSVGFPLGQQSFLQKVV